MAHLTAFNISVDFPHYHSDSRSLEKTILGKAASRFGQDHKRRPVVQALRNISFNLRSGDRLGLVGANGSGKTSLLRALSGIYQPTVGSISMARQLTSLLDPSHGMNMDMTGRENIRSRGYFLGLPTAETEGAE